MRYLAFVIFCVIASGTGWYLYQESVASTETESKQKEAEIVAVEAVSVRQQRVEEKIELVGSLEPRAEVIIRSRVNGYLEKLPFDLGDHVEADSIVAELDNSDTQELVVRADAAQKVAEAQLAAQKSREEQAAREVKRLEELAKSGVSTEQEMDEAVAVWDVAKAELKLEEARVNQAQSDLERSRITLEELTIETPLAGYVAERNAEVGDLARVEDILLRIVDLNTVRTEASVVERDYEKVRVGQTARIEVDTYADQAFFGTVVRKSPVLDPDTRTGRIYIEVENRSLKLKPGMHARVSIVASSHDALVVPMSAILESNDREFVFTVDPSTGQASQQFIRTGIRTHEVVEVLSGLADDAQVITIGSRMITEGAQLEVTLANWKQPPAATLVASESDTGAGSAD
ncbi:efflux RND transporter periplasmic adaptor subunit [bacterium]|nr:efflux RND transporter periplasmic adaptor subunit [bacterium]